MSRRPAISVHKAALALALIAGAVAVGCGGEDVKRLTRAEFISRADAICKATSAKLSSLPPSKGLEKVDEEANAIITVSANAFAAFRKLEPPLELEQQVTQMTALIAKQIEITGVLANAVSKRDTKAVETLARAGDRLRERSSSLAQQIGLKECGR